MKNLILFVTFFYFRILFVHGQDFKLFLIGDTGEDTVLGTTMLHLLDTISNYPNSAVIFLGDNCYKRWIIGERKGFDSTEITIKRLGIQLNGLYESGYSGNVYFIPGNHEWWNVTRFEKGKRNVSMEERFIDRNLENNRNIKNNTSAFLPEKGDPITAVDLNGKCLKLIILDTQWLLSNKNDDERSLVYCRLDSLLEIGIAQHQKIVVAGHHPIFTLGSHSKKHWNQFPKFYKVQDIYHPLYNEMRIKLDSILSQKKYPIIYTSGHDHSLEYFKKDSVDYFVSGSGSKISSYSRKLDFNPHPEKDIPPSIICKLKNGFFELNFTEKETEVYMFYLDDQARKERVK